MSDIDNSNKEPEQGDKAEQEDKSTNNVESSSEASPAEIKEAAPAVSTPGSQAPAAENEFGWAHAFAIVGTLALLVVAFLAYIIVSKRGEQFPSGLGIEEINRNANQFLSEQAGGKNLILASKEQIEHFLRIPDAAMTTGWISPDIVTERLQVPTIYEFGVPVDGIKWKLELEGNVCLATGPQLQVLNIISGNDALNYNQEATTVPRPKEKADPTVLSLQPQLAARALMLLEGNDGKDIRALAKETLESLLEGWLLDIGAFKDPEFATVKVVIEKPAEPTPVLPEEPADIIPEEPTPALPEEPTSALPEESETNETVKAETAPLKTVEDNAETGDAKVPEEVELNAQTEE